MFEISNLNLYHHQICNRYERDINIKKNILIILIIKFIKDIGAWLEINIFKFKTMIEKQNFCFLVTVETNANVKSMGCT